MATVNDCTEPEEGWSLINHFLGNILLAIRFVVNGKQKGWQATVAEMRTKFLGHLNTIVFRMNLNGHGEDAAKMRQICALVEDSDLNDLVSIQAIFDKNDELSPNGKRMKETLEQLRGGGPGSDCSPSHPDKRSLNH